MKEIIYNNDNINLRDVTSKSVRIKVLLINNGKLVIGNEDGCFMFVGGHQEDNEELIDTLKREVKEETGIEIIQIRVKIEKVIFIIMPLKLTNYLI